MAIAERPRSFVEQVLRLDRGLAGFEATVAALALGISLVVSLYTVLTRSLLMSTAEWVLELPMELLVVAAIYGAGLLLSRDGHVSVDFVFVRLPLRVQRAATIAVRVTLALLAAFLAERAIVAGDQASRAGIRIPELFYLSSAIPADIAAVGFALWSVHAACSLLRLPAAGRERPEASTLHAR